MAEPISLALAKQQCRILHDDEDALIEGFIKAAREYVENATSCVLVRREIVEYRDAFDSYVELHRRPVVSIDEVGYLDTAGDGQVYADFVGATTRDPARVYPAVGGEWPELSEYGGVTVTYTAGYAAGQEPQALLQAMLLLISHWNENREAAALGQVSAEVALGVESLCAHYWRPVA